MRSLTLGWQILFAVPLFPIGSVLTDLGLFNRLFCHFGSVLGLFCCQKGLFSFKFGHIQVVKSCIEWF